MKLGNTHFLERFNHKLSFIDALKLYFSAEITQELVGPSVKYLQSIWLVSEKVELGHNVYAGKLSSYKNEISSELIEHCKSPDPLRTDRWIEQTVAKMESMIKSTFSVYHHDAITKATCLIYGSNFVPSGKVSSNNNTNNLVGQDWIEIEDMFNHFFSGSLKRQSKKTHQMVKEEKKLVDDRRKHSIKLLRINCFYRTGNGKPSSHDKVKLFQCKKAFDAMSCKQAIFQPFAKHFSLSDHPMYADHEALDKHLKTIYNKYNNLCRGKHFEKHFPPIESPFNLEQALQSPVPSKLLSSYLHSLVVLLLPIEMFGSNKNRTAFYKNVKTILPASRKAYFTSADLLVKLDLKAMAKPLLAPYSLPSQALIIESLLTWMFNLLSTIISCKLYITETSLAGKNVAFYRFDQWKQIIEALAKQYQNQRRWMTMELSLEQARADADTPQRYNKIRFIPKSSSARPISNYIFTKQVEDKWSIKHRTWLDLLRFMLRKSVEKLSDLQDLRGNDDMLARIAQLKANNKHNDPWWVVRGDFQDCYPSIDTKLLLQAVKSLFAQVFKPMVYNAPGVQSHLPIYNFNTISYNSKGLVRKNNQFVVCCDYDKHLSVPQLMQLIQQQLGDTFVARNVVLPVAKSKLLVEELRTWLKAYMFNNVYFVLDHTYKSCCGLRQGGILSYDLCQVYLNAYYNQHLAQFIAHQSSKHEALFRGADDFIFVTSDLQRAQSFLACVQQPFMGLRLNDSKSKTNFDNTNGGKRKPGECVTFLGRRFDCDSLSSSIDIEKHLGVSFQNALVSSLMGEWKYLLSKLPTLCFPEMFDRRTTLWPVVVGNVTRRMYLQAARLATFICQSELWRDQQRPLHTELICFIVALARAFCKMLNNWIAKFGLECDLQAHHILYITAHAFGLLWSANPKLRARSSQERRNIQEFACRIKLRFAHCCRLPLRKKGWQVSL